MSIEIISSILGWSALLNYAVLVLWALFFILAHDWMYAFHGSWFSLSVERFDAIHYAGMAVYKMLIFVFNLAPWIAIQISL